MPAFDYIALNQAGRKTKGAMEADSPRTVRNKLRDKSLVPISVHETKQQSAHRERFLTKNNLSVSDVSLVTRQIATMVQAGLPLENCLQAIALQAEKNRVKRIILAVRAKVREGHSFADSLQQFPRAFSTLYCATVAAGEKSGHLDIVLARLADYIEAQQQFRQKIQLALIYPVILLTMSIVIVSGLMIYVVPDIVQVIIDAGQPLPLLTEMLVAISDFLVRRGIWILPVAIVVIVLTKMLIRNPEIRKRWHKHLLNLWAIKRFSRGSNASRYISTLAILTRSGIPLSEAVPISSAVVPNHHFRDAATLAASKVIEGRSLSKSLEESGLFPPMMLQLIASGEQSGELADMLQRASHSQEYDLQQKIATMVSLFEPLTLVVMGLVVLVIVLAVLLPILNLNQLVS